jgi:hypothetical protein
MTAFARQLGGRVEFEVNAKGGMTARLIFPAGGEEADHSPPRKGRRNSAAA